MENPFINCTIPALLDPSVCPGLAPPPGVIPMDPNAYTLHPYVIAITVVCATLTLIGVVIRLFTNAYVLKRMQFEDYFLLFAACGFGAYMGVVNKAFDFNCGKHQWNVSIADVMIVVQYVNLVQVLYSPPMLAAKLALLLQIRRIFTGTKKNTLYWIIWALMMTNSISYTTFFFMFIFACVPREKIWNPSIPGKCLNGTMARIQVVESLDSSDFHMLTKTNANFYLEMSPTMIASGVINLVSDLAILVVPLVSISSLQMPMRRKVGVSAIFATGGLAVAASIMRLIYTLRLIDSNDITYWATPTGMWSFAEFCTVILCGCFPTFPPFLKFITGKNEVSSKYSYGSAPNSRQPIPPFSPSRGSNKIPYSWNDTTLDKKMGPYIPLDERTKVVGASGGEGKDSESLSNLRHEARGRQSVIYKTVEIETNSVNDR